MNCDIEIEFENKKIKLRAIIDTGNFLKDPITKMPVVVVESKALTEIIPKKMLENLQEILYNNELELGEYASKIRIIPFTSLGKENGLLVGIKIDEIKVYYDDEIEEIKNVILGIYNGTLSKSNKYSALIGIGLLEDYSRRC